MYDLVKVVVDLKGARPGSGLASELYAKNLLNLLSLMVKEGELNIDLEDQILKDSLITHGGAIVNAAIAEKVAGGAK